MTGDSGDSNTSPPSKRPASTSSTRVTRSTTRLSTGSIGKLATDKNKEPECQATNSAAKNLHQEVIDLYLENNLAPVVFDTPSSEMNANNVSNLAEMAKFFEQKMSSLPTKDYLDRRLGKLEEKAENNT